MKRSFWFVAGASAGVYAAARARRAAEILTVDGLRDRIGAVERGQNCDCQNFQIFARCALFGRAHHVWVAVDGQEI